ncbi:hypothetical protein PSEUDO8AS_10873 [Pseudomonas sp. 8AS]|nr:hypothetical protein PSEUDO8AS_10873 [Pseudomonas sp. 8AS]
MPLTTAPRVRGAPSMNPRRDSPSVLASPLPVTGNAQPVRHAPRVPLAPRHALSSSQD